MKRLILILLLLPLLIFRAGAAEPTEPDLGIETDGLTDGLPSEAQELLPVETVSEDNDLWDGAWQMFLRCLPLSQESFRDALRMCAVILALTALFSVCRMLSVSETAVRVAGALGLCAAMLGGMQSMVTLASDTVRQIGDYSALLLPVLASAAAMSGGVTASGALYAGTVMFSELLLQLISKLLIPAVWFYLTVSVAEAALEGETLGELRSFVGWLISKTLRVLVYVFLAFLSITGVIGGAADANAVKATKAAVSGMVPVVGGIISDASETLLAGAGILKNSIGIFGMLAVLAICLLPFLKVGIHYLLMKLTAAVSGTVGLPPHVKLVRHFSTAMGYLLGMCGACGLLMLISSVCFLKVAA